MTAPDTLPEHVAIIMDGNGRWAQKRGYPRLYGHIRGARRVKEIVREAGRIGIPVLTLYAFSTENWNRPSEERTFLWKLLQRYLEREADELDQADVRLEALGDLQRLPEGLQKDIQQTVQRLKTNKGMRLNLMLSYGSRWEIVQATKRFAEDCLSGTSRPEQLNEEHFESYLTTGPLGTLSDVDLLIRTSGEMRVSNFMLWQAAYAECVFSKANWPDFGVPEFQEALKVYRKRERRFGCVEPSPLGAQGETQVQTNDQKVGAWERVTPN